jgi:hypothetical protein
VYPEPCGVKQKILLISYAVAAVGFARFANQAAAAARFFASDFSVPFPIEHPFLPIVVRNTRTSFDAFILGYYIF